MSSAPVQEMAPPLSFGGMTFRLESVTHQLFPGVGTAPVTLLPDGTEVQSLERDGALYLLVDHRSDDGRVARIETWRMVSGGECPVAGLLALCDSLSGEQR